ncbi:hypothetical protein D3C87_967140 [compost metagenome]|jgi:hypothetical protein
MIVINTSATLADLLPEVRYSLDPDLPDDEELPAAIRRYMRDLILHAFFYAIREDLKHQVEWLSRIRQDRSLSAISHRRWVDVEVVDTEGTFVLLIEEQEHDHRF